MQADRCFACTGCPHAPRRGIGVRTRQRHLAAVRGACRACCAPRKRDCGLICAPRKWLCRPTDALPVLVVRTPPGGALACAPGSGTLPPFAALAALVVRRVSDLAALFVRRVKGLGEACQSLACASRRATPKGVERAPGSGTLPPLCVIERREERGCRGAPLPRGGQGGGEEPPALRRRGSGSDSSKKRSQTESGRCPAGPRLPGLIGSITV